MMSPNSNLKKNRLAEEKRPYLLQHANNPVEWFPWGEEAFEKARKENKPIFLSIGYSTCHWCHVMAHESFEDAEVAKLMNDTFISIKVDREERPDIDNIYMTACQVMTGSGGWPLTIVMNQDKKPFFAGTYFPKYGRFGRAGLLNIIPKIKELWDNKRSDLLQSGEEVTLAIQNVMDETPGEKLGKKTLKTAHNQLAIRYDERMGGFGERPKFPTPHNLFFLLRFWKRTERPEVLEMVEKTLTEMRKGGIYDHVGHGFHRYSTDSEWLVPHFEKMLYDQAMIALAYLETYQATKKEIYAQAAREIFEYVLRDMTSPEGGFYSAEDADSEGVEGKFYVWSEKEIRTILGEELAKFAIKMFNVQEEGNYLEESTRDKTGENILHLKGEIESISAGNIENITKIRKILFDHREQRVHPHKDDKILTDWNGLMIAALAKGAFILNNEKLLNAAKQALNFIKKYLLKPNGRLLHRFRDDKAEIDGYIDDYAFLIWGLIELFEASFDPEYIKFALELNETLIQHFWDENIGGYYFTADDAESLIIRQKEIYDGAIPSGNSVSMFNLIRLSFLTGNYSYEEKAELIGRTFSAKITENPQAYTLLMCAVDLALGPTFSLVISGDVDADDTKQLMETVRQNYIPNKAFIYRPTDTYPPEIDKYASFVEWFDKVNDRATAYICINQTCKPPTSDSKKMLEYISTSWSSEKS